jgi:hypothetical protein
MGFGDTWANAADEKIEPPKGTYHVRIAGGSAFTSRDGDDYCKVDLQITSGDLESSKFEHFMGFKHPVGSRINREALLAYGLEGADGIRSIEDLDDAIGKLKDRTAEVSVSYKDGYMQVKVNGSRNAPGTPDGDIPSNGFTPAQADTFDAAAAKFGDEPAF